MAAMQLIRCTGKLQKELGLKKAQLIDVEPRFSYLGPWHANLIHINRRKCVLFVNDRTLFNFLVPDLSRSEIRELGDYFRRFLQTVVASEGLSAVTQTKIQQEYRDVEYAKSNNKSVIASMNDLAYRYKRSLLEAGGVHSYLLPSIISRLNHLPLRALGFQFPIEALKDLYETAT
jgi:hypothetical protein